jgi:2'-5' RNA ligase
VVAALRVFLAVAPPHEVRLALVDQLGSYSIPGRLIPPDNWHITLRFLGEVDEVACERYVAAIDQSDLGGDFLVRIDHLGAFPKPSKATVIWAGITRGQEHLFQLAEIADERALDAGIAGEERPFRPHLTLSRVRPQTSATDLVDEAEIDVGWRVSRVVLFRTLSGRGTVRYEPLETFSLSR